MSRKLLLALVSALAPLAVHADTEHELPQTQEAGTFLVGIRTNLLYDAALVPNLGAEFALGDRWSVATNWAWAWWSRRSRDRYWRVFGGELDVRRWFCAATPLSGQHVGLYGGLLTYDVMLSSDRGYMGGHPGGGMLERPSWYAGVEYGYSLPVARHLNLDFNLGVGYFHSTYYEYAPIDTHYVWQSTHKRQWIGPTKAEISLVWLLGPGLTRQKKGGLR